MTCLLGWAAAAAVLAVSWALSRRRRQAIEGLNAVAAAMAAGDLSARPEPGLAGPLGRLAASLGLLSARTSDTLASLGGDKARLRTILDNMVEGVALFSADGRVQVVNAAMERLLGVRGADARGRPVAEVLRHAPLQDLARAALDSGAAQAGEATLFVPEERVFAVHATAVPGERGPAGAVLVLHDITRLRRLEELRKEFVANVSHELRTPLASIKSFAETLRLGALEDKAVRGEFVRTIEEQVDTLSVLVDDLLELAAIEGGRRPLEPVDLPLAERAASVAAALKPLADAARVSVECLVPEGLRAWADAGAFERVVRNLLENAVKYNREGGSVRLSAEREGEAVRFLVSDTGLGIPAVDLPRVFERFYRVDKARSREKGGTGLGLSIVKHLVEAMGGAVRAESEEGKGSTFSFTLPST